MSTNTFRLWVLCGVLSFCLMCAAGVLDAEMPMWGALGAWLVSARMVRFALDEDKKEVS